jgi:hypothetical protein
MGATLSNVLQPYKKWGIGCAVDNMTMLNPYPIRPVTHITQHRGDQLGELRPTVLHYSDTHSGYIVQVSVHHVPTTLTDMDSGRLDTVRNDAWRKSTFSGVAECVEVANEGPDVRLRDSKDPGGPVLGFTSAEWQAFVLGVKAGEFDI